MAELAISTGVLIRQQPQILEQITGCESPNRYYVFSQSPQAGMKLLFMCKELSECCQRKFLLHLIQRIYYGYKACS